jgi:hypothetical protein
MPIEHALLLVALFVPAWLGACWLLAGVGGWRRMAAHYAQGDRSFSGETRRFQRLSLGWLANYGRCLVAGTGPEGVRLAMIRLVAVAHPPLLVPWDDITPPTVRGLGPLAVAEFRFARTPDVPVRVRPSLARWLLSIPAENRLTRSS